MLKLLLIAGLLCCVGFAFAAESPDLRNNWLELSSKVDVGYRKALVCEVGARKSDRSTCKDFVSYMQLSYPRISYLSSTVDQLPLKRLQRVVASRDYDVYKVKLSKIAEVSSAWGD